MSAIDGHTRDALAPRPPGGTWRGLALSLLAHALLFAALLWGVRWATPTPETMSAELWASVPRAAAPPPAPVAAPAPAPAPTPAPAPPPPRPAPPPEPAPKADIAIEQARREAADKQRAAQQAKAEKEKLEKVKRDNDKREKDERERKDKEARAKEARDKEARAKAEAEADKKAAAQAEQRLAKQREENLARMMGQLGNAGPSGSPNPRASAGAAGGPSTSYAGRIVAAIKPNIVFADTPSGNPAAEVEVRAGPSGSIIGRTLVKSSGNAEWDDAVLRAIDRTGTLPRDVDGRVPPRLTITFRPRD
jgi:colicin import membrane protein